MATLLDGSFEAGTGWTAQNGASFSSDYPARTGARTIILPFVILPDPPPFNRAGEVFQDMACDPGEIFLLSVWVKRLSGGSGVGLYADGVVVDSLSGDDPADDWTCLSGLVEAIGSSCRVLIKAEAGLTNGTFLADDAAAEEAMADRNTFEMFKALYTRLKTINGSTGGYWNDFTQKIIPRLIEPGQAGAPEPPYICVWLADKGAYEHLETGGLKYSITPEIVLFAGMNESNDIDTGIIADMAKGHDDIIRCLWPDGTTIKQWDLGSYAVLDVTFLEKQIWSDPPDGIFPHVSITVDLSTTLTRAELGSGA